MRGIFHAHSAYSHDGELSLHDLSGLLLAQDLEFCVLTDHSDDLTPDSYAQLLEEISVVNGTTEFEFIPGIEMSCGVAHIILLDAPEHPMMVDWREVVSFSRSHNLLSILAHPTRLSDPAIVGEILGEVRGVEIWNAREDGRYSPDLDRLSMFIPTLREEHLLFFGVDYHETGDCLDNVLEVDAGGDEGSLLDRLSSGKYRNVNRSGISLPSRSGDLLDELRVPPALDGKGRRQRTLRQIFRSGADFLKYVGIRIPGRLSRAVKRRV